MAAFDRIRAMDPEPGSHGPRTIESRAPRASEYPHDGTSRATWGGA